MLATIRVLVVASIAVLAGCASSPRGATEGPPSSTAAAAVKRVAPAVKIPAESTRKVVLAITGSKVVVEAKDWTEFKREWRETFAEHAKQAGVAFAFVETESRPTGEDGTLLLVHVEDYRIVGIGMRIMFGIMTGNAFIDARIKWANLRDGTLFGEQQYNTTSSAGAGIFAKVTPQQVDAIAHNVFLDFKSPM
jgi:hypothetical protein